METAEKKATYSKKVKALREQKYVVRPIRRKGSWVPPDHDSAFLNEGSKMGLVVPNRKQGLSLVDPLSIDERFMFTETDRELLSYELGIEPLKFNTNTKNNFWKNNTVFIERNGLHLNLAETDDFVKFLILNSDKERIAPSWAQRFDKGTFKFALCEEHEELVDKVSNLEEKKRAFLYMDKIDKSVQKMSDFLFVYYLTKKDAKHPPATADGDWLRGEVGRIIEDDLNTFLGIMDDPDYTLKLLINRSVAVGALMRNKHLYTLPGADQPIGVLEDVIAFLDDPKNQDVRMKLMNQVETANKK